MDDGDLPTAKGATPGMPKPPIISAHVAGSGTTEASNVPPPLALKLFSASPAFAPSVEAYRTSG